MSKTNLPSLRELQTWMKWRITPGSGPEPSPICRELISDTPVVSREQRLDIYADAFISRIVENMEEDFMAVAKELGDEAFFDLVEDYISQFPSTSPTVNDLGKNFPAFLLLHEISAEKPHLFELATFEWALLEALYIGSNERADLTKLQGLPEAVWGQAQAVFQPSVKLFRFQEPVHEIWKAHSSGKNTSALPRGNAFYVMVYGSNEKSFFESMNEQEFKMLRLLQKGASIEHAVEESGLQDPALLNSAFTRWMSWGIFSDFDTTLNGCD